MSSIKGKYKTYQVPIHLYLKFEQKAKQERQDTGKETTWSGIIRRALEKAARE